MSNSVKSGVSGASEASGKSKAGGKSRPPAWAASAEKRLVQRSDGRLTAELSPLLVNQRTGRAKTSRELFVDRLRREGRYAAYEKRFKEVYKKGDTRWVIQLRVFKEFGYMDGATEFILADEWVEGESLKSSKKTERLIDADAARDRRSVKAAKSYRALLAALPDSAPSGVVLDWILAHPAMIRYLRRPLDEKMAVVQIKAEDIEGAPSKSAVNQLWYWANHPAKFFETMLTVRSKRAVNAEDSMVDSVMEDGGESLDGLASVMSQFGGTEADRES